VKTVFYVLFIAVAFLISCSGLDETSSLGKSIIEDKSQDGLNRGVYKTINLSVDSLESVADKVFSGKSIAGGYTQWAIGNWDNEETILKLTHDPADANSLRRVLHTIATTDGVTEIKVELVWSNDIRLNASEAAVEVGAIFNGTNFFPLNYDLINSRTQTSSIPLTIETYLLEENRDSTVIKRFDITHTRFVDINHIDTTFIGGNVQTKRNTIPDTTLKKWKSDKQISWRDLIASSLYNDSLTQINGNITVLRRRNGAQITAVGTVTQNNDTMIIAIVPGILLDSTRTITRRPNTNIDIDSIIEIRRYLSSETPDTLIQHKVEYQIALNDTTHRKIIRKHVGGNDNLIDILTNDTLVSRVLNMYLRIDKNSSIQNILHLATPALRVSYKKRVPDTDDKTTSHQMPLINFTDVRVITNHSELTDTNPVISGNFERFAKIELDWNEYFSEIKDSGFLSVGLADLTLSLDSDKTDFPAQYGDSILVNAIISDKELTPKSLYALLPGRKRTNFIVRRDSSSAKINLTDLMRDFVYEHRIFENDAPENTYLYLWLDNWRMGRIWFEQEDAVLTYILQTRKGGEQ